MSKNVSNTAVPFSSERLTGRPESMPVPEEHYVLGTKMNPPYPEGLSLALFGMGCFWGAEQRFWQFEGMHVTAVGYAAGITPNPSYDEVCSGLTGHNEVVQLVFDPERICYEKLLGVFFQSHNPTQGMRQGNDIGTQYRSAIYFYSQQQYDQAENAMRSYQAALLKAGFGKITTELLPAPQFYFAEEYHQQYPFRFFARYCWWYSSAK